MAKTNTWQVNDKPLVCPICTGARFEQRRGVLDTRGMAWLGLSWLNRGSTEFICGTCGFVMTFADKKTF